MQRNILLPLIGVLAAIAVVIGITSDLIGKPPRKQVGMKHIVFATDWKAEAEHGGFYEAKALGLYAAKGLDVEIKMGGPSVNIPQLLGAKAIDFGIGSNQFIAMNIAQAGVPAKAVMAAFQKDPEVLITHPRDDVNSVADMAGKPIMISDASVGSLWLWLRAKFGFKDDQIRKYTFNLAPFLSDQSAIQQGYITSEPYQIEKEAKVAPKVFLLADYGYPGYAGFILARDDLIKDHPEIVKAFVQASIEGWKDYLTGDPVPANKLIKADNPEMTDDILTQAIEKMRASNLVIPAEGGAQKIGQMSDDRWKSFYETMSGQGLYPKNFDYKKAYTLDFLPPTEK
ncbi:MAG: ABC transporter substrate-binding protein [Alphaproteobacteria bacterium]